MTKLGLLLLAILPGCALFTVIPQEVREAHTQEAVAAKAIHDVHVAVLRKVDDPDAKLLLLQDALEKWETYVRLHAAVARGLQMTPVLGPLQTAEVFDLLRTLTKKP